MTYSYRFRLKVVKLVTERDFSLRETAKRHAIRIPWSSPG